MDSEYLLYCMEFITSYFHVNYSQGINRYCHSCSRKAGRSQRFAGKPPRGVGDEAEIVPRENSQHVFYQLAHLTCPKVCCRGTPAGKNYLADQLCRKKKQPYSRTGCISFRSDR